MFSTPIFTILFLFISFHTLYADDRVKIEMYTESLCPYCIQLITTSFKIAFETKDINLIADFHLYPYGNAKEYQASDRWIFKCQHGENECVGNLMENCAFDITDYQNGLAFAICLEENIQQYSQDFAKTGSYCAGLHNIDINGVNDCMQGERGNKIQHEVATKTEALQPPHNYVPWVVVNDQHDINVEDQVFDNMLGYICKNYKGTVKIDACSAFLAFY